MHGAKLAAATTFRGGLRRFAEARTVHGECGGYMVLGESMVDAAGQEHRMVGLLSVRTSFAQRKLHLGYRDAELFGSSAIGSPGTHLRGHEFHYASVITLGQDPPFAMVRDAYGSSPAPAGSSRANVTGSFFHFIAAAS